MLKLGHGDHEELRRQQRQAIEEGDELIQELQELADAGSEEAKKDLEMLKERLGRVKKHVAPDDN